MKDAIRVACGLWLSLSLLGCKITLDASKPDDAGMHSPESGRNSTGASGGQGAAAHGGTGNPSGQGGTGVPQGGDQGRQPGAGTGGMSSGPHARVIFQLKGVQ